MQAPNVSQIRKPTIHVGCSGWVYKHWRGILYLEGLPQRLWFKRYSDEFDTVEINASFYRVDTDLVLPQLSPETWTLTIDGMVDRPVELTFRQLIPHLGEPVADRHRCVDPVVPARDELVAAHPDQAVDAEGGDREAVGRERALPGEGVQIGGVDERPVDVEEDEDVVARVCAGSHQFGSYEKFLPCHSAMESIARRQ